MDNLERLFRNVSVIVASKTCTSFYDTDIDTDSDITHAQENYPGQKSSSSQDKGKYFEDLPHISLYD